MTSRSRWHEMARATIEELSADADCRGSPQSRRRWLMGKRPGAFAAGYPAQVWKYEVDAATGGLPDGSRRPRLTGEWPMTEEQEAFFDE